MVASQNRALSSFHKMYKKYIASNPYSKMSPGVANIRKLHDMRHELALRVERLNSLVENAKGERKTSLAQEYERVKIEFDKVDKEFKKITWQKNV